MTSGQHRDRITEMATCDKMIGPASSNRRWSATPGLTGPLNKKRFLNFWGSEVADRMGEILRHRMAQNAVIEIKHSKKRTSIVRKHNLRSLGFCCVSYPGQGKYDHSSGVPERAIRWEDMLEEEEEDTRLAIQQPLPDGSGFWPAIIVFWDGMAEDAGLSPGDYITKVIAGILVVYIICWYQLVDGTWTMTAWPVLLASRL